MKYLYIIILLLLTNYSWAQKLNVRIINNSGNPVHAATIYIPEIRQGLISDIDGQLQILLEEGTYTVNCFFPGYKEVEDGISISKGDELYKEFVLEKDSFYLYDNHTKIDTLANHIIKKSNNKAPEYQNAVQWYKADFYLKGKLIIGNVHSLLDKVTYRLSKFHISQYKDKILTREMYNEMEYLSPNRYEIKVYGNKGNIPEHFTNKGVLDPLKGSIYSDRFGHLISPLCNNARHYYKFRYEGFYQSQKGKLHKIKVIPKFDSQDFFEGLLYIEDSSWGVKYAEINAETAGMDNIISISYNEIQTGMYLPVTYHNDVTFNYFGAEGEIKYYTALRYNRVSKDSGGYDTPLDNTMVDMDSDSGIKNEICWDNVRLLPLKTDSINQLPDTFYIRKDQIDLSKNWKAKVILGDYITGDDTSRLSLKYNGVKMIFRDYNYVDGFWLGEKFDFKMRFSGNTSLEAYPYIYYITGRNRLLAGSDISYKYEPKRKGKLTFNMNSRTEDYNNLSVTRYQNYFASLFFGENYNYFYQRDEVSVNNSIHINSKIKLSTSLGVERRRGLKNNTDFNLLNRRHIKPNIFPSDRFDRTYYSVGFSYSPHSDFSITEALEMYEKRVTPVFNVEYQEGFSSWQTNNSTYRKLKGGFSHNIQISYFSSIDYKLESGVYLTKGDKMHFVDYQHFGASDLVLNLNSLFDSFLLLEGYEFQTNKSWFNLFLNYSDKYLLLKRIPFLQKKPFTESLHLKSLVTPDIDSYVEAGYSISLNRYFGMGTFLSLQNTKVKKLGFVFSLNLRSLNFD